MFDLRQRPARRTVLLASVGLLSVLVCGEAGAQTSAAATPASSGDQASTVGEVVVTGTRLKSNGYREPTPVTVLGAAEIAAQAPPNIVDFVATLPSITAGSTAANGSGNLSTGTAGIATVDLRGLGPARTLVLIDGQRSVASDSGGDIDINTIPQDLISRVEVVTGGASAQYGSDAVAGVVNFVLNDNFKGMKFTVDQSITTYGDGHNTRLAATFGKSFTGDRLHVLLNAEYSRQSPVNTVDRPWNNRGFFMINNPAYTSTNGQPQRIVGAGIGPAVYMNGGIINSGPLTGTYFLGDGVTGQLNYGVTNSVSSPWMIGGDWQKTLAGIVGTNTLIAGEERDGLFTRAAFDANPHLTVYGEVSWNRYHGTGFYEAMAQPSIVISSDNAYLVTQYPQIAAAVQSNSLSNITIGTTNGGFPIPGFDNTRNVYRFVAGAKGNFSWFNNDWSWDAYYHHGVTDAHEALVSTYNATRVALAQDAVVVTGANVGSSGLTLGSIACRSTLTNPTNGCVPLDRLGTAGPSQAALNYIYNPGQPTRDETFKLDVAAFTLNGQLGKLPGGPVAIATGAEWRKEQIGGSVDPTYQSGWYAGNYRASSGQYSVSEGFIEADFPLFKDFNFSTAGRYTDYSTTGGVRTWKLGSTYSPIEDIKFRATYSHDLRSPKLQEVFGARTTATAQTIFPSNSTVPGLQVITVVQGGNPAVTPESSNTWTAGVVLKPRILPGVTMSFDYYDIQVANVIGIPSGQQQIVNLCYAGYTAYCNNIHINGSQIAIDLVPTNFNSQHEKGFDIEASYSTPLSAWSKDLPGELSFHAQVTHYLENIVNNGTFPIDYAGVNGGTDVIGFSPYYNEPNWVYRLSAFYRVDPFKFNLVARGFSSGVYGNDYVQCTTGCPASTPQNITINNNHIPGATYFDGSVGYQIHRPGFDGTLTFVVSNMFNKAPASVANGPGSNFPLAIPQTNRFLYDTIGRVFRVSLTANF